MKKMVDKVLESGIVIQVEEEFQKRDKMSRKEWKVWFAQEEITEEEFRTEMTTAQWPLDDRIG